MKTFQYKYNTPEGSDYISPRLARTGLITGLFIYSIYGFLDLHMFPIHFKEAWTIRYLAIAPFVIFYLLLTFNKSFIKAIRFWLSVMLLAAMAGITAMHIIADPNEGALWNYYTGYILISLWGAFIFRLKTRFIVALSLLSLALFNWIILSYHAMLLLPDNDYEMGMIINNNYLIVSSSVLTIIGAFLVQNYREKHDEKERLLIIEKEAYKVARDQARESDRLKSSFLSNMSHEIRTPLNAILGFSELLKHPHLSDNERLQFLDIINIKGDELLQLINDIIDLSKIEAKQLEIKKEFFDISELMAELKETCNKITSKDISKNCLEFEILQPENTPTGIMFSDKKRLKQILDNLIINAYKFTEDGKIELGYRFQENGICFFVKDTGIGIPSDKIDQVFDRFTKLDEDISTLYGGTGLGLNIVKNLVELLNGKIWIDSIHGKGSTFSICIPAN